ncbi:hypothetical protein MNBD_DELTA02-472, partial [hydrothermal vent metagenome]
EEQSATTEEISTNITNIATVTTENTDGVRQVSAASDDLAKIAEELKDIVSRFKLRGVSGGAFNDSAPEDPSEPATEGHDGGGDDDEGSLRVV